MHIRGAGARVGWVPGGVCACSEGQYLWVYSQAGHGGGSHTQAPTQRELQWAPSQPTAPPHLGEHTQREDMGHVRLVRMWGALCFSVPRKGFTAGAWSRGREEKLATGVLRIPYMYILQRQPTGAWRNSGPFSKKPFQPERDRTDDNKPAEPRWKWV